MKKKLIIAVAIVVMCVGLLFGYAVWSSRNTAVTEAKKVLEGMPAATASQWYCENGAGKGIDNSTPWWEETHVSNAQPEETAKILERHLKSKGYFTTSEYIENSQDPYNAGKTYWQINGTRNSHSVKARVSSKVLTLNNCFKQSSNMDKSINPENYNSVVVIQFR